MRNYKHLSVYMTQDKRKEERELSFIITVEKA
jgi:hypothetical protein